MAQTQASSAAQHRSRVSDRPGQPANRTLRHLTAGCSPGVICIVTTSFTTIIIYLTPRPLGETSRVEDCQGPDSQGLRLISGVCSSWPRGRLPGTLAAFQSLWCHNGILASVTSPSGDVEDRLELQLHLSATCPVLLCYHFLFSERSFPMSLYITLFSSVFFVLTLAAFSSSSQ